MHTHIQVRLHTHTPTAWMMACKDACRFMSAESGVFNQTIFVPLRSTALKQDGGMGGWRDGEMAGWQDGRMAG